MRVDTKKASFQPVVITLETEEEAANLLRILDHSQKYWGLMDNNVNETEEFSEALFDLLLNLGVR